MRVAFIYLFYVWCFVLSICQAQNVKEKWSPESVTLFTTLQSLSILDANIYAVSDYSIIFTNICCTICCQQYTILY